MPVDGVAELRTTSSKSTADAQEYFVRAIAHDAQRERLVCACECCIGGVTAEQAKWKDKSGNHSIEELANHLIFWDDRALQKFKGGQSPQFSGNNEETFNSFDSESWNATVQKLDKVLTDWEKAVEDADESKLKDWYSTIAHIGTHNAYHTGQIIYIRRLQGSWDPAKGVK